MTITLSILLILTISGFASSKEIMTKKIAYIVSDIDIPFWDIMKRGIQNESENRGYTLSVYSAGNDRENELNSVVKAMKEKVDGIIVSPTSSAACATILKLTNNADIPVVISDIGTDGGNYVSYISSNNLDGAYKLGKVLTSKMISLGWENRSVGIIAIPQKRLNGQARTAGFLKALDEAGIKSCGLKQQATFSEKETYSFCMELIRQNTDVGAIWLQGSDKYRGALRAIADSPKKNNQILLLTFDAEPEFIEMIRNEEILGAAMQQPYLMGQKAVRALDKHLRGDDVKKNAMIPIMAISKENIAQKIPLIRKYVLGLEE